MKQSGRSLSWLIRGGIALSVALTCIQNLWTLQTRPLFVSVHEGVKAHRSLGSPINTCKNNLQGVKVLLLDVHMEGNLGDEMETTPLLQHLHECGAHVTVALSNWLKGDDRFHYRTSREHHLVDKIVTQEWNNFSPQEFTAVVVAPGPWAPCWYNEQFPHTIHVYFGGTFFNQSETCTLDTSSLLVTREPLSYQFSQKEANKQSELFMSGDLSFSFRPAQSALQFWVDYYTEQGFAGRPLIFSRANNFDHGVKINQSKSVHLKTISALGQMHPQTLESSTKYVFASSSDIEDKDHFDELHRKYSIHRKQLVMCKSVEQLWALISIASHVYTDRYHPGVAAHIHGVPFSVLDYPGEQVKLKGLSQLAHLTGDEVRDLNRVAFNKLDSLLIRLAKNKTWNAAA